MNTKQKNQIRKFIVDQLYKMVENRVDFVDHCESMGIDAFEGMEGFEREVERINKLFCYPAEQIGEE